MRRFGGIAAAAALAMLTTAAQGEQMETLTLQGTFRSVATGELQELTLDAQSEEAADWETIVGERYHGEFTIFYDYPWVSKAQLYMESDFVAEAVADPPVCSLTVSGDHVATVSHSARCAVMDIDIRPMQIEGEANADEDDKPKPTRIIVTVLSDDRTPAPGEYCRASKLAQPENWVRWGFTEQDGTLTWGNVEDGWWIIQANPGAPERCGYAFGYGEEFHIKWQETKRVTFRLSWHKGIKGAIEFETFGSGYWADVELWQDGQCVQTGIVSGDANEDGKYPYTIGPPPPAGTNYAVVATYRDEAPQEKPVDGGVPNDCAEAEWVLHGYTVLDGGGAHEVVAGPNFTFYGDGGQGGPP